MSDREGCVFCRAGVKHEHIPVPCRRCGGRGTITDMETASIRTDTVPPTIECPECAVEFSAASRSEQGACIEAVACAEGFHDVHCPRSGAYGRMMSEHLAGEDSGNGPQAQQSAGGYEPGAGLIIDRATGEETDPTGPPAQFPQEGAAELRDAATELVRLLDGPKARIAASYAVDADVTLAALARLRSALVEPGQSGSRRPSPASESEGLGTAVPRPLRDAELWELLDSTEEALHGLEVELANGVGGSHPWRWKGKLDEWASGLSVSVGRIRAPLEAACERREAELGHEGSVRPPDPAVTLAALRERPVLKTEWQRLTETVAALTEAAKRVIAWADMDPLDRPGSLPVEPLRAALRASREAPEGPAVGLPEETPDPARAYYAQDWWAGHKK